MYIDVPLNYSKAKHQKKFAGENKVTLNFPQAGFEDVAGRYDQAARDHLEVAVATATAETQVSEYGLGLLQDRTRGGTTKLQRSSVNCSLMRTL